MEVKITTENIEQYKSGELPLVVDLWATWCGPCRMIAPIVSKLAEEYSRVPRTQHPYTAVLQGRRTRRQARRCHHRGRP